MAACRIRLLAVVTAVALAAALAGCTGGTRSPGPQQQGVPGRPGASTGTDPSPGEPGADAQGQLVPSDWADDTGPGRGYDLANSDYFSTAGLKTSFILDVPRLVADHRIRQDALSDDDSRIDVGRSIQTYSRSVSAEAGIDGPFGLFRDLVHAGFGASSQASADQSFLTARAEVRRLRYFIEGGSDPANLDPYLTPGFRADVNDPAFSPRQLFTTYGTHLPYDLAYGGILSINFLYTNSSQESDRDLGAGAHAVYDMIVGHASTDDLTRAQDLEQHSTIAIRSTGGTIAVNANSISDAAQSYGPWEATVDAGNPASLSFAGPAVEGDRLADWALPIWDFAVDPARAKSIRAEFDKELADNAAYFKTLQAPQEYLKDIYVAAANASPAAAASLQAKIPTTSPQYEFAGASWDLNRNAGGEFIYIGFTLTTDPRQAITDIVIVDGEADSYSRRGVHYISSKVDLNKGAGGDFLTLFYTRSAKAARQPGYLIRDIGVQTDAGKSPNIGVGANWGILNTDLNKGAGGDFVYLWYQLEQPPPP